MVGRAEIPHSRRVAIEALYLVGERLAYLYDPARRGYVDETVGQLCDDIVPPISHAKVLRAVQVLGRIGVWTVTRQGGSRERDGSRRIPGPELCAAAHRLGLDIATRQTALDLSTTESTGALRSTGTESTGALRSTGTESTGARTESTGARTESTGAHPLIGKDIENHPPTPLPGSRVAGLAKRRAGEIGKAYARQELAARSGPPIANVSAWLAKCHETALAQPRLYELMRRWPTAPPDSIASWLRGESMHTMGYFTEAAG
jgi:hypothetical protein